MNIRGQIQGFAIGAAVMAAVMMGGPALFSTHAPVTDADQIAAKFGVTIVWSVDRCGAGAFGCAFRDMQNTVYISPSIPANVKHDILLHELGHIAQFRLGLPTSECGADRFAQSLGVTWGKYCEPGQPDS